MVRVIKYFLFLSVLLFGLSTPVFALYATTPTVFPSLSNCSQQCNNCATSCPWPATCTDFCNYNLNPPACGYTCSNYQNQCASGNWGSWGPCTNCWQFRVCNSNSQLGQTQCCVSDAGCNQACNGGIMVRRAVIHSRLRRFHPRRIRPCLSAPSPHVRYR